MNKVRIHTYDVFNFADDSIRMRYFDFCHEKALEYGLQCKCYIEGQYPKLELWGSKYQFVKYYCITLFKTKHKMDGFKRLISIIRT